MKAIVQDRYGSPDVLRFRDIDAPVAGDGQVLVRVHAASVNAADWHIMRGDPRLMRLALGLSRPKVAIRGRDLAGRVEAVGRGVTGFQPGDEVFGEVDGSLAEYVSVPVDQIGPKPANLTFEQAAALPLAGITALLGLRDRVRPGDRILVNGASGGVGTFAVQLARHYGAEVTAVCRTRNVDLVRSLGADHVIDYTREDFTRATQRYHLVFDLVGNRSLAELRRVLTPTGTLLLSGGGTSGRPTTVFGPLRLIGKAQMLSRFVRQRLVVLAAKTTRENLAELRELAEAGALVPIIDRTFPLSAAAEAIRYLETEHARAKVVVTM